MSLIGKSEFLFLTHVVNICGIILFYGIFSSFLFTCLFNWLDFLDQMVVLMEEFVGVDSCNNVDWDVWGFMLETAMDIDVSIN